MTPLTADVLKAWLKRQPKTVASWVRDAGFEASPGSTLLLPGKDGKASAVLVGVTGDDDIWSWAAASDKLPKGRYRLAREPKAATANRLALGWGLAAYKFTRYKGKPKNHPQLVWPKHADKIAVEGAVDGTFLVRDLINTPASDMGPAELADAARKPGAVPTRRAVPTITGDDLLRRNFPAIHAVGRASVRAPRLIDLKWGRSSDPKITLVGKGVCFDTGGLDLKGAAGMLLMKKDMGGAAHVLGLAHMIMASNLRVRLRVLIPAVENAVSGNAYRPMDVIATRKGLTVEIGNTDAEGRVVLSDALALAAAEKPAVILDFATLTGAARIAAGTDFAGDVHQRRHAGRRLHEIRRGGGRPRLAPAVVAALPQIYRTEHRRPQQYRKDRAGRCDHGRPVPSNPSSRPIFPGRISTSWPGTVRASPASRKAARRWACGRPTTSLPNTTPSNGSAMAARSDLFHPDYKPEPYWWEAARPGTAFAADLPSQTEVLIVGSGYAGLSAALELARYGRTALVVEKDAFGIGASTRKRRRAQRRRQSRQGHFRHAGPAGGRRRPRATHRTADGGKRRLAGAGRNSDRAREDRLPFREKRPLPRRLHGTAFRGLRGEGRADQPADRRPGDRAAARGTARGNRQRLLSRRHGHPEIGQAAPGPVPQGPAERRPPRRLDAVRQHRSHQDRRHGRQFHRPHGARRLPGRAGHRWRRTAIPAR